jgi:molybdopterin synthase catalytic subunit
MLVRIVAAPFDPYAALKAFQEGVTSAGAVASFIGVCRGETGGVAVAALTLEHFEGFTQVEIRRIVACAIGRFRLSDALVIHRSGRVLPGEPIVLAAAASAHRRASLDAVDYLMDHLKTEAPFWKKEEVAGGARWIEPRAEDTIDKTRWTDEREA